MDEVDLIGLAITAIMNFIPACEVFYLAGMYFKIGEAPYRRGDIPISRGV